MKPTCKKWAVADGRDALGIVRLDDDGKFVAVDTAGQILGRFETLVEASRAFDNMKPSASGISRARKVMTMTNNKKQRVAMSTERWHVLENLAEEAYELIKVTMAEQAGFHICEDNDEHHPFNVHLEGVDAVCDKISELHSELSAIDKAEKEDLAMAKHAGITVEKLHAAREAGREAVREAARAAGTA